MLKRIAFISDHASPLAAAGGVDSGGQNIYVAQVARHLARQGFSVDVFTRKDNASLPEVVAIDHGVRVFHVPAGPPEFVRKENLLPTMPDFAAYMARVCAREGPYRLIHANFFMSGLVALILKRELRIPFVMTFHALGRVRRIHQPDADEFPPERMDIEQTIIQEADAVIAECPQDESDLLSLYRADPRKICVIPCGFDATEFWPIAKRFARKTLGLPERQPLLLNLGRLVPRKGIDNAIRALGRLRSADIAMPRLMVVGGNSDLPDPALTPEIARLRALAQAEDVAGDVVFAGRRSRELLKLYYSAADLFVTTPWYEPFGITPLEAMACGTPVIGSEVGGIKYSVVDGVTGRLVPANDPDALADAVADLYRHPNELKEMGRNAIRRVNRCFTWSSVATSIASLYARIGGEAVEIRERVAVSA
jgi:glycosyltransferase involved in cell wall biosynthesis